MKIFEMRGRLPETAGLAQIQFTGALTVRRVKDQIILPAHDEVEWFPIKDGSQFILRLTGDVNGRNNRFWFGGTDEKPFLVEIQHPAFEHFQKGGEEAFYTSLKPLEAHQLERAVKTTALRQGDIFAVPLPHSWKEIENATKMCFNRDLDVRKSQIPLFGTRHEFKGSSCETNLFGQPLMLAEGKISAPDHAPLEIPTVHALFQAANLSSPREAD